MVKLYAPCVGSMLKLLVDIRVGEKSLRDNSIVDFHIDFCVGSHGSIKSKYVEKADTPDNINEGNCWWEEDPESTTACIFYVDTTGLQPGMLYLAINIKEEPAQDVTAMEVARYDTDIQLWEIPQVE